MFVYNLFRQVTSDGNYQHTPPYLPLFHFPCSFSRLLNASLLDGSLAQTLFAVRLGCIRTSIKGAPPINRLRLHPGVWCTSVRLGLDQNGVHRAQGTSVTTRLPDDHRGFLRLRNSCGARGLSGYTYQRLTVVVCLSLLSRGVNLIHHHSL
jgi:hypothetical protein